MGRVKEKKRSHKARSVKIRGAALVQGAADSVKMRTVMQLREVNEGEARSDYGEDQIENAVLYTGRLSTRGAEAFVRSHMEKLAEKRREASVPPLYDLPFDLTGEQETPSSPGTSNTPAIPELPPANSDNIATVSAVDRTTAPLELPEPEKPAELPEKRSRHRSHSEPEPVSFEKQEEAWTPAFRDGQSNRNPIPASEKTTEPTPDRNEQPPKIRTREGLPARKTDRDVKTPRNRHDISIEGRQTVKEKGGVPVYRDGKATEPGRQKLIREQVQKTRERQYENRLSEKRPLYANSVVSVNEDSELRVPRMREASPVQIRDPEPRTKDGVSIRSDGGGVTISLIYLNPSQNRIDL